MEKVVKSKRSTGLVLGGRYHFVIDEAHILAFLCLLANLANNTRLFKCFLSQTLGFSAYSELC